MAKRNRNTPAENEEPEAKEQPVINLPETKSPEFFNIGNGSFHVESVKGMTKEDFISAHKGRVIFDLGEVYDYISKL